VSIVLAACGGSSSNNPSAASAKQEERQVKFARCLREHGLNVETGTSSSGSAGVVKIKGGSPQVFERAQNACKQYRPSARDTNASPAEKAARLEGALKFARCMRSHGINIPDPTSNGNGISIRIHAGSGGGPSAGGPNPESPTFQAAQNACQGLLGKNAQLGTSKGAEGAASGKGAGEVQALAPAGG
jgi:hypothetical protein